MSVTQVPIELSSTPGIVDNSNATAITIDSSENVGIGASPSTKLQVTGNSSSRNTIVSNVTLDGGTTVAYPYSGFGFGINFIGRDYGNAVRNYASINTVMEATSSNSGGGDAGFKAGLSFYTNGGGASDTDPQERLRIESSGNVAIGTSGVSAKLHIAGSPQATNGALVFLRNNDATTSNTSFGGVHFSSSPGTDFSIGKANVNSATSLSFRNGNTGASLMELNSSGRLSINTTSASELLNIANTSGNGAGVEFAGNGNTIGSTSAFYGQGSGNDAYVWNRADSTILFGTNNTERLRIDQYGSITGTMFNATNSEYDGDLDSLKKTGFYRSKNTNNGNPSVAFYSVVVYGNQGNVTAQIATLLAGPATYVRSFNVSWTSWVRIDD